MITQLSPQDNPAFFTAAIKHPVLSLRPTAEHLLVQQNPSLPYRFFSQDSTAFICQSPLHTTVLGTPTSKQELLDFLNFTRTEAFVCGEWFLNNPLHGIWHSIAYSVLSRKAGGANFTMPAGTNITDQPAIIKVIDLLNQQNSFSLEKQDDFYADLSVKCNRAFAKMYALHKNKKLLCVAGVNATIGNTSYLADVETLHKYNGLGYATAVIGRICCDYSNHNLAVICEKELEPFYAKLGFCQTEEKVFLVCTE